MPLYLFFTVVPLALILGFLGGLWLSKRSLVWCDRCGETLTCAKCLSRYGGGDRFLSGSPAPGTSGRRR